ncbi:MAG TPA: PIN domain-containing protein [Dissulfurispiraceae bacterium]|nr:PIN domain-containing protein [Dissulfurispiraceae bacterium]
MLKIISKLAVGVLFIIIGSVLGLRHGILPIGVIAGVTVGALFLISEAHLKTVPFGAMLGGFVGLGLGLLFATMTMVPLESLLAEDIAKITSSGLAAFLGYGGFFVGLSRGKNLTIPAIMRLFKGHEPEENQLLLDSSVVIDGRIADVIETGFIEGVFVIPQFILHELQYIADSPDPMRRTKGRRGLDIMQRIQKMQNVTVKISDQDFPKIREVDAKLVALARILPAKIITNDFNLNKVAQLQGVGVLNINELANVLKPVVLPGEALSLFIVKDGKEQNQGVAYLDDGTMVVIENSRKLIGKNVEATVTSVLQTTAGRMIFAKLKDEEQIA